MRFALIFLIFTFSLFSKAITIDNSSDLAVGEHLDNSGSSASVIYKIGTLGLGIDFEYMFNTTYGARVNLNGFSYRVSGVYLSDNKYSFEGKLASSGLLFDYHPWQNAFRFSSGVYKNRSKITGVVKPSSGQIDIGDRTYPALQIGSIDTKININDVNPYLGVGFSSVAKDGWHFVADIGALYIGKPKATLKARAAKGFEGLQNILNKEAQIEEDDINKQIEKYKWYPVLSVGLQFKY
jgi:hypothetical protein